MMMSVSVYSEYQCVSYYTCLSSQNGDTALMLAAIKGKTEVIIQLIQAGAHLNLQDEVQWLSILYVYYVHTVHDVHDQNHTTCIF